MMTVHVSLTHLHVIIYECIDGCGYTYFEHNFFMCHHYDKYSYVMHINKTLRDDFEGKI